MKMTKILATMAASAISVGAFAAMSLTASAADVIGKADLEGQFGTVSSWDMSNAVTEITGDGQYEVVWDTAEPTNTGTNGFFVTVVIIGGEGVDGFTKDTFENLSVTLDEVYILLRQESTSVVTGLVTPLRSSLTILTSSHRSR